MYRSESKGFQFLIRVSTERTALVIKKVSILPILAWFQVYGFKKMPKLNITIIM